MSFDAEREKIQHNTFTRWASQHLQKVNQYVYNLETDLSDGLLLIHLVQVLSGKKLPRFNKKPSYRSQKLENVSVALKFLEKEEGIKIVNIDSSDIVDQRLKLILGLIWVLILHYSISIPMWDGEEDGSAANANDAKETPKQRLMNWIQVKATGVDVENFTTDWNDGRALGALVDSVAPGLCPDWNGWAPENALENITKAMDLADNWLGVPKLLEPHEIIDPKVDERSVMTYLSQYPNAQLKEGAPLRGPTDWSKVHAFGPGLEGGVTNLPCDFTVECNGETSALSFAIKGPSHAHIDCKDNGDGTAEISYLPTIPGEYAVHILCADEDIPGSPYMVEIAPYQDLRSRQVRCYGEGVEKRHGLVCGQKTEFTIDTNNAGKAALKVWGLDTFYDPMDIRVQDNRDGTYSCRYTPKEPIKHTIMVSYGGVAVAGSPYRIFAVEPVDPGKVRVSGPGVEYGVKSQTPTQFSIDCKQAGPGELQISLTDKKGNPVEADVEDNGDGAFNVRYTAPRPGPYQVRLVFAGTEISGSPIRVVVQPHLDVSGIRVDGLESRVFVDSPTAFTVDARAVSKLGGLDKVACFLLTPANQQFKVPVVDNGNGTYIVQYVPQTAGTYHLEVLYENIVVPQFPLAVLAEHSFDSGRCRASGPGLDRSYVGVPAKFTIETKGAGAGDLGVSIEGPTAGISFANLMFTYAGNAPF